jgi:predicted Zn-dependent protease
MARREAGQESTQSQMRAARRFVAIGMPEEAREVLQRVVREDPRNLPAWDDLEQMHRQLGDLSAVVTMWQARSRSSGDRQGSSGAPSDASIERLEDAVRSDSMQGYWTWRLSELEARQRRGDRVSSVELAAAHAGLGHADPALEHLEQAAQQDDPRLRLVRTDPVWDPYRRHPRYIAALKLADEFGPPRGDRGGRGQGRPPDGGRGDGSGRGGGGREGGRGGQGGPPSGGRGPGGGPVGG